MSCGDKLRASALRRVRRIIFFAITLALVSNSTFAQDNNVTEAGDALQYLMPLMAVGSTLVANGPEGGWVDREGFYQATKSQAAILMTQVLWKQIAKGYRPNFGSTESYPSGHTAGACGGGDFLTRRYWDTRYNWLWTLIGQSGCLFTAYSRIQADAHFINDVTASYGLAWMYNLLFVTPKGMHNGVSVMPMSIDGEVGGVALHLSSDSGEKPSAVQSRYDRERSRRWRFLFGWGPAYMERNQITSPRSGGTTFDLNDFEKINDPFNTSLLGLYYDVDARNNIYTEFYPLEARDLGTFSTPVNFNGTIFPAGDQIASRWRQYEFRFGWSYDLDLDPRWITRLGAEFELLYLTTTLESDASALKSQVDELYGLPLITANLGYRITPKVSVQADVEGIWLGDDSLLDAGVYLSYSPTPRWLWHLGVRYYQQNLSEPELENKFAYTMPILALSYLW